MGTPHMPTSPSASRPEKHHEGADPWLMAETPATAAGCKDGDGPDAPGEPVAGAATR